jgi:hypothetical protein
MKRTILLSAFTIFCLAVGAQTAEWLWPVQGEKAGEDILYRPQDYIGRELNFDNLIIGGQEGTPVICPAEGTVAYFNLCYNSTLTSGATFSGTGSCRDMINQNKDETAKKFGNPKYLCFEIIINTTSGHLNIVGIMPSRIFKTGERVHAGQVLGTMMYGYKGIDKPCILFSHSVNSRSADPMKGFGLKSTFKAPKPFVPKEVLTREEAVTDYKTLASSVREIYPSLDELMPYADYDAFVAREMASIPARMPVQQFVDMVNRFNARIHDSHFYIDKGATRLQLPKGSQFLCPPLYFSKLGDSVIVALASEQYKQFEGKAIAAIDSVPISRIVDRITEHCTEYDAKINSTVAQELAFHMPFDYALYFRGPLPPNSQMTFTFAEGQKATVDLRTFRNKDAKDMFGPQFDDLLANFDVNIYRGTGHKAYEVDSLTAYLGINNFSLSQVETDEVVNFIRTMAEKKKANLIIDLRNNRGGEMEVLQRIVGCLIDKPTVAVGGYCKVNKKYFTSPIENIPSDMTMFDDYDSIPGRQGLYVMSKNEGLKPDSTVHYSGRIYVLQNSNSASASADFSGYMVRNHRGYVVGQETCTAYGFMTAIKFANVSLPNSNIKAIIPMVKVVADTTESPRLPHGRGVIPDLVVPLTRDVCFGPGDAVLAKTLKLIKDGVYL